MPSAAREYWICDTCAVQVATPVSESPPEKCKVCEDDRQYRNMQGQNWTTPSEIAKKHKSIIKEEEPGVLGLGVDPPIGNGNRALLVQTGQPKS